MNVVRCPDASAFLELAGAWLLRAEIENNVIHSIATSIADGTRVPSEPPYFAVALDDGAMAGCAIRTPPHRVLVGRGPAAAHRALAADAFVAYPDLPGVTGPDPAAGDFAEAWCALAGTSADVSGRQRLYSTNAVDRNFEVAPGTLRLARLDERDLALQWFAAFAHEAMPHHPTEGVAPVDRLFRTQGLFFWDRGGPVTLCGVGGRTPTGARVGPVYTPPEYRKRGYATATVAALTMQLLQAGERYCCLYTDLANPTSNSIYQRVGYRPLCDVSEFSFVSPKQAG
jgi:predicted GNAT family acetyltransferase